MVRYEIQFCGSLHAHIILWIENSDVEHIANEITAIVSAEFDTTMKKIPEPTYPHQNKLFKEVMRKQLHSCGSRCQHKLSVGTCKCGFHSPLIQKQKQHITQNKKDKTIADPKLRTVTLCYTRHFFFTSLGSPHEYTKDQHCVLVILLTQIYIEM